MSYLPYIISLLLVVTVLLTNIDSIRMVFKTSFPCRQVRLAIVSLSVFQLLVLVTMGIDYLTSNITLNLLAYVYLTFIFHLSVAVSLNGGLRYLKNHYVSGRRRKKR